MEEDIKILKGFLEECKHELMLTKNCWALEMKEVLPRMYFNENTVQALENILNRLEQDERIIEEMAEYIEYVSSDGDKDVMYAELYNCNQLDRNWTRGKEAEIKDILKYFRKKCE